VNSQQVFDQNALHLSHLNKSINDSPNIFFPANTFLIFQIFLVFDSWSKIPPGIFRGNRNWLGAIEQCRNIKTAKYCIANVDLRKILGKAVGV